MDKTNITNQYQIEQILSGIVIGWFALLFWSCLIFGEGDISIDLGWLSCGCYTVFMIHEIINPGTRPLLVVLVLVAGVVLMVIDGMIILGDYIKVKSHGR